ncbi:MAG: hypothetical protein K6E46_04660 [Lachnospiraceae bacterium]|nr:hypothetical protein [Lachnospiraceae bacterium]
MKFKYYLRGAGVGLIVATVILMIVFSKHNVKLSDDDIIARAKELGMVMEDSDNKEEEPSDNEDNGEDNSDDNGENNEKPDNNDNPDDNDNTDDGNDDNNENGEDNGGENETEFVEFVIRSGEFSDVVSNHLYEKGLIDDPAKYNEWLMAHGYDKDLQPGTFMIPKGATYEEIAKILVYVGE